MTHHAATTVAAPSPPAPSADHPCALPAARSPGIGASLCFVKMGKPQRPPGSELVSPMGALSPPAPLSSLGSLLMASSPPSLSPFPSWGFAAPALKRLPERSLLHPPPPAAPRDLGEVGEGKRRGELGPEEVKPYPGGLKPRSFMGCPYKARSAGPAAAPGAPGTCGSAGAAAHGPAAAGGPEPPRYGASGHGRGTGGGGEALGGGQGFL